jgi:midasin
VACRYVMDESGKLVFMEGALVQAVRQGHWLVLDELNLAPTDVLEALNRLLDDNRELFVPELNEMVTPHPHFCLFATQVMSPEPPCANHTTPETHPKCMRAAC